ncbi:MAG: DsbA family protein, partial [Pseudomonadota bacterium]
MNRLFLPAVFLVALAIGGYFAFAPTSQTPANPLGAANAQEAAEVDTSSVVEMQIGNPDAPVTVIEYASYTCPHCATFHQGPYKQLKADYIDTGKINFVYREVYFDQFGLWASAIARCAGPDKFFGITDMLYASQSEWRSANGTAAVVDSMRRIGRLAGLDNDSMEACLQDNDKLRTLVAWYQQNAQADGIDSTPSFVINGTKYSNMSYDRMAE